MKMFDDIFDKTFKKYVLMDTFRLPMCVKELRLFSEKICQSFLEEYSNHHSLTLSSSSKSLSPRSMKQYTSLSTRSNKSSSNSSPSKNAPIGMNSLSKTFNIIKILGQGNFGRVYKMENKFDHRLFALKQILITPKEDLRKVLQEVENLSRAGKHKNIVKYLDCFLIQEESFESGRPEDTESSDGYSEYTDEKPEQTDSFINFQEDVSDLQQIFVSNEQKENRRIIKRKSISISVPEYERSESALGYSKTITCICIKVKLLRKYKQFIISHLLDGVL